MTTNSMALNTKATSRRPSLPRLVDFIALGGLIVLLIVMLFPLFVVTVNSFKTEQEYYANGPMALPQSLDFSILQQTWEQTQYTQKLVNSLVISLSVAVLASLLSLLNAFALSIGKIRGRAFFLIFFLMAITLPPESLVYPLYYLFKQLGLYDTQLSVILIATAFHSAYGTYLMSSVLNTFSKDLLEAAKIDGANKFQLLFRIITPLNWPALSLLFVFFFIWTWNDFFLPLIFLISNAKQTVPLAVVLAQGERNIIVTRQSAAALLGIVPCIIFFLLFQRTLARGVTAGSVK